MGAIVLELGGRSLRLEQRTDQGSYGGWVKVASRKRGRLVKVRLCLRLQSQKVYSKGATEVAVLVTVGR